MSVQAYPLHWPEGWPRSSTPRKSANFGRLEWRPAKNGGGYKSKNDITMTDALRRVKDELERLGVDATEDMIISTNLQLNLSGLPRGNQAEPIDPGAAVYFQSKGDPMRVIAIDAYNRVRDNIAAIAASAKRTMDLVMQEFRRFGF